MRLASVIRLLNRNMIGFRSSFSYCLPTLVTKPFLFHGWAHTVQTWRENAARVGSIC